MCLSKPGLGPPITRAAEQDHSNLLDALADLNNRKLSLHSGFGGDKVDPPDFSMFRTELQWPKLSRYYEQATCPHPRRRWYRGVTDLATLLCDNYEQSKDSDPLDLHDWTTRLD
jgi:hypothetical protein